jgi:predicted RNA-binding Zn-ribbon protein involved in translation (DUF1610 family)
MATRCPSVDNLLPRCAVAGVHRRKRPSAPPRARTSRSGMPRRARRFDSLVTRAFIPRPSSASFWLGLVCSLTSLDVSLRAARVAAERREERQGSTRATDDSARDVRQACSVSRRTRRRRYGPEMTRRMANVTICPKCGAVVHIRVGARIQRGMWYRALECGACRLKWRVLESREHMPRADAEPAQPDPGATSSLSNVPQAGMRCPRCAQRFDPLPEIYPGSALHWFRCPQCGHLWFVAARSGRTYGARFLRRLVASWRRRNRRAASTTPDPTSINTAGSGKATASAPTLVTRSPDGKSWIGSIRPSGSPAPPVSAPS